MANLNTKTLLQLYFKLKVYKTSGTDFQTFFSNIMSHLDNDFVQIKPHGNWGDGGNDGCNPKTKHYYQIYAPLATTNPNPIHEFNKATQDYEKLLKKWIVVNGYSYVINDRFTGIPATLQLNYQKFMDENKIDSGKIIGTSNLQTMFMELEEGSKLDVLDMYCIDESPNAFEPSDIGELIKHLVEQDNPEISFLTTSAPDVDEKIKFNRLSYNLEVKLKSNLLEVYKINEFLSIQGEDMAQSLSRQINEIYKNISSAIPILEPERNEVIYLGLIDALIPKYANQNKLAKKGYTAVAEIIIAKYFETCDTYENPSRPAAT